MVKEDLHRGWQSSLAMLTAGVDREDRRWLEALRLEALDGERIRLGGVPNAFFARRIQHALRIPLLNALQAFFPELRTMHPRLELHLADAPHSTALAAQPLTKPAVALRLDVPQQDSTQHTYLVSESNAAAWQLASQSCTQHTTAANPLLVVGPAGSGKSALLEALAQRCVHANTKAIYLHAEHFKREALEAIRQRKPKIFREPLLQAPLLFLDGLEALTPSPRSQEELQYLIDHFLEQKRAIVCSAVHYPNALRFLPALRSRLESGLIIDLPPPDLSLRCDLAAHLAQAQGIQLSQPVLEHIATRSGTDLRRIQGAVHRLAAYANLEGCVITNSFVERIAAPLLEEPVLPAQDARQILATIAQALGTTSTVLCSRTRTERIATARKLTIGLLREVGQLSHAEIGRLLGGRSISTVAESWQSLRQALHNDSALRKQMERLRTLLATQNRGSTPEHAYWHPSTKKAPKGFSASAA